MPREAMLFAYTRNSARAMNQQDSIGSLAPGMQADLVLLDRDVLTISPEELKDTKVVWTMLGGVTVYGRSHNHVLNHEGTRRYTKEAWSMTDKTNKQWTATWE